MTSGTPQRLHRYGLKNTPKSAKLVAAGVREWSGGGSAAVHGQYKAETVRLIESSGKSIGKIALKPGMGETALRRWVDQAAVEAGRGNCGSKNDGPELLSPRWTEPMTTPEEMQIRNVIATARGQDELRMGLPAG